jgi:membrane-associated phospholipid phosphatase
MRDVFVPRGVVSGRRAVPIWVGPKWKWRVGWSACALVAFLYLLANRYSFWPPAALPLTALDLRVPFLPWTIWIYLSGIFYLPTAYFLCRCVVCMNKHLYSFVALAVIGALIFAFAPTTYPRELFPLPEGVDALTSAAFRLMRAVDRPTNCAPSLHVAIACLVALGFLEDQRRYFPWMAAWAVLLAVSTLTTKQHYVGDVQSGAVLAALVFVLFHLILPYRFTRALSTELKAPAEKPEPARAASPRASRRRRALS